MPVPDSATLTELPNLLIPREFFPLEFPHLALTLMLPITAPAAVGAKVVLNVAVCPGARVTGKDRPLSVKFVPFTTALLIVQLVWSVFERTQD